MFIIFTLISIFLGLFWTYMRSTDGAFNCLIKTALASYTLFAIIILFSQFGAITLSNGMRLL